MLPFIQEIGERALCVFVFAFACVATEKQVNTFSRVKKVNISLQVARGNFIKNPPITGLSFNIGHATSF